GVEATIRTSRINFRNIGALSWRQSTSAAGHDVGRRDPASDLSISTGWDPRPPIIRRDRGVFCPPESTIKARGMASIKCGAAAVTEFGRKWAATRRDWQYGLHHGGRGIGRADPGRLQYDLSRRGAGEGGAGADLLWPPAAHFGAVDTRGARGQLVLAPRDACLR